MAFLVTQILSPDTTVTARTLLDHQSRNVVLLLRAQLSMHRYMVAAPASDSSLWFLPILPRNNVAEEIIDDSSVHRVSPKPDTVT